MAGRGAVELGFRAKLAEQFDERRERNPRYSLRAFAAFLGTDHSTLSQILRGSRRTPARQLRSWGKKLGLGAEETAAYIAAERLPDPSATDRELQVRHWTAEAMAIVTERAHWEILRLSRTPEFRPDCRWIAEQIGGTADDVNLALSRLLRLRLLKITPAGKWTDLTNPPARAEAAFRKIALARVREQAAEFHIKIATSR